MLKKTNAKIASKVMTIPNIQNFLITAGFIELDSDYYCLVDTERGVVNALSQYFDSYIEKYSSIPKEARVINASAKKAFETRAEAIEKIEVTA